MVHRDGCPKLVHTFFYNHFLDKTQDGSHFHDGY